MDLTSPQNTTGQQLTNFGTGGPVSLLSISDVAELIATSNIQTILGLGCNVLISDEGLPGTTVRFTNSDISIEDTCITVGSGCNWDNLVIQAIDQKLWGLELTSGIPGSVGAAVVGNIAAYGQAVKDTLESIELFDLEAKMTHTVPATELDLEYRRSNLQNPEKSNFLITKATFKLSKEKTHDLTYASATSIRDEKHLGDTLNDRRAVIMEARRRAQSLLDPTQKTAGSFFRNPLVTTEQAEHIMSFEENDVKKEQILNSNRVHGGDSLRVSAAHALLAAGFERGQTWGGVRLNDKHILKLENIGTTKSQDIYDVSQEIVTTVKEKLDVTLEPEVRFLGMFS